MLLAIGHSSRDLFRTLQVQGLAMEAKPFAVGFRIEHPQSLVNSIQHRQYAGHPRLGAASYQLTWHDDLTDRGCYTFCMCPGGQVVAAASESGRLVVNGMSYHARDLENANSALLVNVGPADFGSGVLDGVVFQEKIEEAAFALGGGGYVAPVQRVEDFLRGEITTALGSVRPSVRPGYRLADLSGALSRHPHRQPARRHRAWPDARRFAVLPDADPHRRRDPLQLASADFAG